MSETGWWIWFGPVRHYHRLPIRTCKQHGGFGLVRPPITNPYQPVDLGRDLPLETFTNLYHRDGGLGIDLSVGGDVRWCGSRVRGGQGYIQLEWWYTLRMCRHHGGRYRKDFFEIIRPVG